MRTYQKWMHIKCTCIAFVSHECIVSITIAVLNHTYRCYLSQWGLMLKCLSDMCHRWFSECFVACSAPRHYLNPCTFNVEDCSILIKMYLSVRHYMWQYRLQPGCIKILLKFKYSRLTKWMRCHDTSSYLIDHVVFSGFFVFYRDSFQRLVLL